MVVPARVGRRLRRGRARVLVRAGLVQRDWLEVQTEREFADDLQAAVWYLGYGRSADASPHRLFEPSWAAPGASRREGVAALLAAGSGGGAPAHPLVDVVGGLAAVLTGLAPTTRLGAGSSTTTYARWAETVDEAQRLVRRQAALAGRRTSPRWDMTADDDFVARWTAHELPRTDGPLVSIVMPVRNRPEKVRTAVASVQAQTLAAWELLVVDDGSTDDTADVVARLAADDPRVRLIRRAHGGVCAARNAGIEAASAPYVAFLDSDNTWVRHFLQVMVAAMAGESLDAAYAVVDEVDHDHHHRFRIFQVDEATLQVGNAVDLNVLVVTAERLAAVGGFDPTLRRMVDYDLVWRLAKQGPPRLLPFVGVRYSNSEVVTDRISTTESFAWDDVVKSRHLVDWAALRDGVGQRRDDLVSVVVPARSDLRATVGTVRDLLDGRDDVEVVVAASAVPVSVWRLLWAEVGLDPRVRLVRSPGPLDRAALVTLGLEHTSGDVVVVVPAGTTLGPEGLDQLVGPVRSGAVAATCAAHDGVVACAAATFVELGGLDPLFTDALEVADLALRLGERGLAVAETSVVPRVLAPWPAPTAARQADNVREWQRRWPGRPLPEGGRVA